MYMQDATAPMQREAWESAYRRRSRIWGGTSPKLPKLPEESSVLELGCGNGKTLSAMLGRSWNVAALDVSLEALRLARAIAAKLQKAPLETNFVMADASHLPFRDSTFDAVFSCHVMGHLLLDQRCLMAAEAARVLKAKGRLFFLEFGLEDMRAGRGKSVERGTVLRGDGIFTHYFSEEEVFELFRMLRPVSMRTEDRTMRIIGVDYLRSEICTVFVKD